MSVRLFHKGARLVMRGRRSAPGHETWWVAGHANEDWRQILERPLLLLDLDPRMDGTGGMACTLGTLTWTTGWRWVTIDVRLDQGSAARRTLVTAALLKAARYGRIRSD